MIVGAREAVHVAAVRAFGFTERQARFLLLVLEHSGMCVPRQYRAFAGIAHGRQTQRLLSAVMGGVTITYSYDANGSLTGDADWRCHRARMTS